MFICYLEVYVFKSDEWKWTQMDPKGEIPKECSYGACWYDGISYFK